MTTRESRVEVFIFCLILLVLVIEPPPGFADSGNDGRGCWIMIPNSQPSVVYGLTGERNRQRPSTIGETFRRTIPESREIMSGILPWNWDTYWVALGIGIVTLPLISSKDDIQEMIGLNSREPIIPLDGISFVESDEFYTHYEFLGGRRTIPALSGAFVLGGLLLGSQREVETGLMLIESLVFTAAVTGLGQLVLAEERPYEGGELRFFHTHGHGVSGHSSVSASMVIPLDRQYLGIRNEDGKATRTVKYLGKGFLYSAPVMVGISRVRSNRHYLWNVILGLGIGYSVGKVVADVHGRSVGAEEAKTRSWRLLTGTNGAILSFGW